MYLYVYITQNKDTKYRLVNTDNNMNIGDTNNYGWILINRSIFYKNKFISFERYEKLSNKEIKRRRKFHKFKKKFKKIILEENETPKVIIEKKYIFWK